MKQTAVEWLVEKLEIFATEEEMNIIEQAKAMEKEQIENAYRKGFNESYLGRFSDPENHYNETFKQQDDELRTKHD